MNERHAWIALASVTGVGEETLHALIGDLGSAANALEAVRDGRFDAWFQKRRAEDGRVPMVKDAVAALRATAADLAQPFTALTQLGLWTYTSLDADYPMRLRDLPNPPAVLHGLGDRAALHQPRTVGIVGTRRPTPAGRALTAKIAARLVEWDAIIVSGLAVGIDGVAHAAALEHNGTAIGVIGGGHRHPGPRAHQRLRDEVVANGGAVISEHHPDAHPTLGTFPRRNRIIAALSDALILVEAPVRSGAINTANHALGLGRPVFIAPGRVGDWSVAGALKLLRETPARPLVGLDELIEDLGYLSAVAAPAEIGAPKATSMEAALATLGAAEQAVARRLARGPAGLDLLVVETGYAPQVVSSAVTFLLMRGWAHAVGPAFVAAGPLAA
ncbi:MAG TPA: DNA-processing protein DprA [Candidatus Limnocylindria bacterium]|nr:DNA-processing protein DprA [Candidatus Limnocylindria bacterium]